MEGEPRVLAEPDTSDADSLVSTNVPDDLENEQTWPTEEEMRDHQGREDNGPAIPDAKKGTTPRRVKRVPKGWSEYQAAWIVDQDDDEAEADEEVADEVTDGLEGGMEEDNGSVRIELDEEEEMEEIEVTGQRKVAFEDLDMEEESRQCVPPSSLWSLLMVLKGLMNGVLENA